MSKRFNTSAMARKEPGPIDFSEIINPLGTPVQIVRAVKVASAEFSSYPDALCSELTQSISEQEDIPADQIVVTAGATEAFTRIVSALRPHKALLCTPSYEGFERALKYNHTRIVHHSLVARENFDVTERFIDYIESDIDMVFLCSPNNPTGRALSRELLCKILREASRWGTWVVVDESFLDLSREHTAATLFDRYPQLIVVRSFSASYAMAGLRVGWCACGSSDVARRIQESGMPSVVSAPAQAAAKAAIDVPGYLDLSRDYIDAERERLEDALRESGTLIIPSQANFILFQKSPDFAQLMQEEGITICPCGGFRGLDDTWFRVAVRTMEENKQFIAALKRIAS